MLYLDSLGVSVLIVNLRHPSPGIVGTCMYFCLMYLWFYKSYLLFLKEKNDGIREKLNCLCLEEIRPCHATSVVKNSLLIEK